LIVDFNKVDVKGPEDPETVDYLFDWVDPNVVAKVSPAVFSQNDLDDWPKLIAEGWGNDAVICLFSRQEKPALLENLRACARAKTHEEGQSGGIVGYCWPSVMAPLLAHYTPEFVQRLLAGIDAVLVEFPDLPETWQIYGQAVVAGMLDQLGFLRQQTEGADSEDPHDKE